MTQPSPEAVEKMVRVIDVIPMAFLIANSPPGATGPSDQTDVVQAVRDMTAAGRRVSERAARLLVALRDAMPILERAESNASGNPEFDYVGPRVAACRRALAESGK